MRWETVSYVTTVRVDDDTPPHVQDALACMAQHCDEATLAGVAARMGVAPGTLARQLRRFAHAGFGELLAEMRMRRASELLAAGVRVPAVAAACGYGDVRRFEGAYARHFGVMSAGEGVRERVA